LSDGPLPELDFGLLALSRRSESIYGDLVTRRAFAISRAVLPTNSLYAHITSSAHGFLGKMGDNRRRTNVL